MLSSSTAPSIRTGRANMSTRHTSRWRLIYSEYIIARATTRSRWVPTMRGKVVFNWCLSAGLRWQRRVHDGSMTVESGVTEVKWRRWGSMAVHVEVTKVRWRRGQHDGQSWGDGDQVMGIIQSWSKLIYTTFEFKWNGDPREQKFSPPAICSVVQKITDDQGDLNHINREVQMPAKWRGVVTES